VIKVKIYPPAFCSFKNIDDRGWMMMEEGSTLSDALKMIRMPKGLAKIMLVKLNGLSERMDTVLEDGDVIGFFHL
jgi:hypothetical protein